MQKDLSEMHPAGPAQLAIINATRLHEPSVSSVSRKNGDFMLICNDHVIAPFEIDKRDDELGEGNQVPRHRDQSISQEGPVDRDLPFDGTADQEKVKRAADETGSQKILKKAKGLSPVEISFEKKEKSGSGSATMDASHVITGAEQKKLKAAEKREKARLAAAQTRKNRDEYIEYLEESFRRICKLHRETAEEVIRLKGLFADVGI